MGGTLAPDVDALLARFDEVQDLLAQGQWQEAAMALEHVWPSMGGPEDSPTSHAILLQWLLLRVESAYLGYVSGAGDLQHLHDLLARLVEQLELMRRTDPHMFETLWLFGRFDVYERRVAIAYSLGLVADAADWVERTKSRRLLDLLLNHPFEWRTPDDGR